MNIALKIKKEIEKERLEIDLETIQKIIATYERLEGSNKKDDYGPLRFRSDIFLKDDSKSFGPQGHKG
jgi:hypothetical protein